MSDKLKICFICVATQVKFNNYLTNRPNKSIDKRFIHTFLMLLSHNIK